MSKYALPMLGDPIATAMAVRQRANTLERVVQNITGGIQGDGGMISANSITADNIAANTITANEIDVASLSADLIVTTVIETGTSGARLVIDSSGLHTYDATNTPTVQINSIDGSAYFSGTINSSSITASNLNLIGLGNVVTAGASLAWANSSGVSNPSAAPTVSANWTKKTWADTLNDRWGGFYDPSGFGSQPTILAFTTFGSGGSYSATRVLREYDAATLTEQRSHDFTSGVYGQGAVRVGSYIYALVSITAPAGGATDTWRLMVMNQADLSVIFGFALTTYGAPDNHLNALYPGMFYDGAGNIYLVGVNGTGTARIKLYQFDIATIPSEPAYVQTLLLDSSFTVKASIAEMSGGVALKSGGGYGIPATDAGTLYLSVFEEDNSHSSLDGVYAFDLTTLARTSTLDFGAAGTGDRSYGSSSVGDGAVDLLAYDGTNMWGSVFGGTLGQFTNEYWSSDSALVFEYTWYDGTHESMASPAKTMTGAYGSLPARSGALVAAPAFPANVTQTRFYVGSTSALANQHLQDTQVSTMDTLTTYTSGGANPPASNNFPASTPGVLTLPSSSSGQRPTATLANLEWNTDVNRLEVSDGTMYVPTEAPQWGGMALQEALFSMAGQTRTLKAQNFPLWVLQNGTTSEAPLTSGRNVYLAIYWPGGAPTGIVWVTAVAGAYTDGTPNSGFQLFGASASTPVNSATTTLTRITNSNTTASPGTMWQLAAGMNNKAFGAGVASLPAGIYYLNIFYVASAGTAPELAVVQSQGADYQNKALYSSPTGFPMNAGKNSDTTLQSSVLISGLTTTFVNCPWVGLY